MHRTAYVGTLPINRVTIFNASLQGAAKTWLVEEAGAHSVQICADLEHIALPYENVSLRQPQEK